MSACPFKVGETYPDGADYLVEIIHILPDEDESEYPVIGVRRESWEHSVEKPSVEEYTLEGRYSVEEQSVYDLIPPAPPMKRVPLGPEDVPPGSAYRKNSDAETFYTAWYLIWCVDLEGIWTLEGDLIAWENDGGYEIKVPGGDWQPMWKEIPADATPEEIAVKERWAKDIAEGRMAP